MKILLRNDTNRENSKYNILFLWLTYANMLLTMVEIYYVINNCGMLSFISDVIILYYLNYIIPQIYTTNTSISIYLCKIQITMYNYNL